jgi:hypothetical protein
MGKVDRTSKLSNAEPASSARRTGEGRGQGAGRPSPQLAIRVDGAVLLSTEDLTDCDLTGRETFTCIVLRSDELAPFRSRADDAAAAFAAEFGAKLRKRSRRSL